MLRLREPHTYTRWDANSLLCNLLYYSNLSYFSWIPRSQNILPSLVSHSGLLMATVFHRATSPTDLHLLDEAAQWRTRNLCSSKSENRMRKTWLRDRSSLKNTLKGHNNHKYLTWPAWDSEPGLQPNPPSKFIQDSTNSTALSMLIASNLPYREISLVICIKGPQRLQETP